MSRETERELLTRHFQLNWNDSDGPVAWPNMEFTTPTNSMFVVFSLVERVTNRASLGASSYLNRAYGSVQIDIYTPIGKGTKASRVIAERLERVYDSLVLVTTDGEAIHFQTPSSRVLPTNEMRAANLDDNWSRYVVDCPFYRQIIVNK